jgi:hypothetical protein
VLLSCNYTVTQLRFCLVCSLISFANRSHFYSIILAMYCTLLQQYFFSGILFSLNPAIPPCDENDPINFVCNILRMLAQYHFLRKDLFSKIGLTTLWGMGTFYMYAACILHACHMLHTYVYHKFLLCNAYSCKMNCLWVTHA